MEIQGSAQQAAETAMLKKSLSMEQELSNQLISGTLSKMSGAMASPAPAADAAAQKAVLSEAYAAKGLGTKLDTIA